MSNRTPTIVMASLLAIAALGLLSASGVHLWRAGAVAIERVERRERAAEQLLEAEDAVVTATAPALALIPSWPDTLDPFAWQALDQWLRDTISTVLTRFPGVEAGFFVPASQRYVGHPLARADSQSTRDQSNGSLPPDSAADLPLSGPRGDLVEAQIRQALRRNRVVSVVVEMNRELLQIRAAPLELDGRTVAAAWSLHRLESQEAADQSMREYAQAARFALASVAPALLLAITLALTTGRLAREKQTIQSEMRRSERLAALGKLLAGVAHEVRNPLTGIRSTAQLWQRGLQPDEQSIADLLAEVDRIQGLVTRLLQFSRTEAARLERGDLNALTAEVARLTQAHARDGRIQIVTRLEASLPTLPMDEQAIVQLIRNLITNAIQAMPEGGKITLTTRRLSSPPRLELSVQDEGPGLSDEVRTHLFEPFYTTRPEGTGLGLALAREIALAHGGDLRAAPFAASTAGAEFILSLPLNRNAAGPVRSLETLTTIAHELAHPGG